LEQHHIVEKWHEVPVSKLSGRTHMGKIAKLSQEQGWEVRLAKTVVTTTKKNGSEKTEDFFWLGGAKPSFDEPDRVFLFNKFYATANGLPCGFEELKEFVSV